MHAMPVALRVTVAGFVSLLINSGLVMVFLLIYWEMGRAQTFRRGVLAESLSGTTLVIFQVVLYAALALSVALTTATSVALTRALRAHVWATVLLTLFLLGMAALPFLGWVSFENDCALGRAFPFGGAECGR